MDGIKKKQSPSQAEKTQFLTPKIPTFSPIKKEDLYIPKEETHWENKTKDMPKKRSWLWKIVWIFLLPGLFLFLSYLIFFLWKTHLAAQKMTLSATQQTTFSQDLRSIIKPVIPAENKHILKGQDSGRINILLLGAAGKNQPGGNLTDTVMIMSVDTRNKKLALLSLPRDFYAPFGDNSHSFTKINSLYKIGENQQTGTELINQAVEKITGLPIHYNIVVDFAAFEKIINDIGGINVLVERDIYDARYPGPNYSYQTFELKKGAQQLDGQTALKYVRQRHDDPEGDFGRAKRQQKVIQAVKNKLFSLNTFFNVSTLSNVLNTLGDNIKTNMTFEDIDQFIKLSQVVDTQNITNVVLDAWKPESLLKVSHVAVGDVQAFILIPRVGNYSEIQDLAKNIFDQSEIKKRQAAISAEDASIAILNQSGSPELGNKLKKLLSERLNLKKVRLLKNSDEEITISSQVLINTSGSDKIFTLDELLKKLPATLADKTFSLETQEDIQTEDLVIIVGSDLIELYKYEENTMEDLNEAQEDQLNF